MYQTGKGNPYRDANPICYIGLTQVIAYIAQKRVHQSC